MAWRIIDQLHVLNLAVCPTARRCGTGSKLLRAAMDMTERQDLHKVTLEVREGNTAARMFYSHHGFRDMGRRPGYYRDTGEDAIIMTWIRQKTQS
jgi:ribosomal-protein-alanine N-acetyltransferase